MRDMNLDLYTEWRGGVLGWVLPGGGFMPVIAGGADGEEDEGEEESDDEPEEEEEDDEKDEKDEDELKDPKAAVKAANEKADRVFKKLKKKDKTIAGLQKELEDLKKDASSPDEKVQTRLTELETRVKTSDSTVSDRDAVIAILNNDEVAKLPRRRRDLITKMVFDQVEIDEDGDDNVEELLEELRSDDPDLFETPKSKSEKDESEDEEDDDEGERDESSQRRRTAPPPKKKKGDKGKYDRATLEKRMPHLRRHR